MGQSGGDVKLAQLVALGGGDGGDDAVDVRGERGEVELYGSEAVGEEEVDSVFAELEVVESREALVQGFGALVESGGLVLVQEGFDVCDAHVARELLEQAEALHALSFSRHEFLVF